MQKKDTHEKKFVELIYKLQKVLEPFIKQIILDSYNNPGDIYIKLGLEYKFYKIGIFNKKTGITVIKHYPITEYLELMQNAKKSEFEINRLIKQMLLKSEDISESKIIEL